MSQDQNGPAELVPPDQSTVLYAIGELKVYLDLYPFSEEGRGALGAIIDTLRGIHDADTKKAVSAVLEGVVVRLMAAGDEAETVSSPVAPSATPAPAVPSNEYDTVCAEILRRETWLSEMRTVQADLEELLEETEGDIQNNTEKLRFCPQEEAAALRLKSSTLQARKRHLENTCNAFTALHGSAKGELEQLRQYQRALETVRGGCPKGLLGVTLPSIPSFSNDDAETGVITVREGGEVEKFEGDRHAVLARIASEHGMTEAEVFIFSLFELFGPRNERLMRNRGLRALNRGCRRVVDSALSLLGDLRWKNHHECYSEVVDSGRQLNESGLIEYRGSPSDAAQTFTRTEKPLPWDSSILFSPSEIAAFVAEMALTQEELRERG